MEMKFNKESEDQPIPQRTTWIKGGYARQVCTLILCAFTIYFLLYILTSSETTFTHDIYHPGSGNNSNCSANVNIFTSNTLDELKNLTSNLKTLLQSVQQSSKDIKKMMKQVDTLINATVLTTNGSKNTTSFVKENNYLLTLFTTWLRTGDNESEIIHNNTLVNWASFKPVVQPVLITNDSILAGQALMHGWDVINMTKIANNGLPILKQMYVDTKAAFDSFYYGFANSDILFDGSLLKTLLNIQYTLKREVDTQIPLLVTGKRWNVIGVTKNETTFKRNLQKVTAERGTIFSISAEDFFITNKIYPWKDIPEVVIGAIAYDNWLVMNARERKFITVDVSKTMRVVHQSIDSNDHRSHTRDTALYNRKLLSDLYKTDIPYHKGFIDCIEKYTDEVNDTFVLLERNVDLNCLWN